MTPTSAVIPTMLASSSLTALLAPVVLVAITAVLVTLAVLVAGLVTEFADHAAVSRIRHAADDVEIVTRHAA